MEKAVKHGMVINLTSTPTAEAIEKARKGWTKEETIARAKLCAPRRIAIEKPRKTIDAAIRHIEDIARTKMATIEQLALLRQICDIMEDKMSA